MGNRALLCGDPRCADKCIVIAPAASAEADSLLAGIGGRDRSCDPTGAIFVETLEELNDIDKQLLLFSSSANLVAVRWLVGLGADPLARDRNGTTCLHAACRSGSPRVVEALIKASAGSKQEQLPLFAVDVAGWTPLHIAAFMGRQEAVALLLKARAAPTQKNVVGLTATDLCSDMRTRDVLSLLTREPDAVLETFQPVATERSTPSSMRYEPYFVPRTPLIRSSDLPAGTMRQLASLGREMFNQQPGRGLAFVVACGCARDYPVNLVAFLRDGALDRAQVGHFLGEAFSLSKILRLEYINSSVFTGTGIVSSLSKVFANLKVPPDLRKLDRLMHSLAEVWWRQHDRELPFPQLSQGGSGGPVLPKASGELEGPPAGQEVTGTRLRKYIVDPEMLHQLLFSSMLLHWNLHAPLPESQRLSLEAWIDLNRGIGGDTAWDLPNEVLVPIYDTLRAQEHMHLQILPAEQGSSPPPPAKPSPLSQHSHIEGWARVLGNHIPLSAGLLTSRSTNAPAKGFQVSGMLSEATDTARHFRDGLSGRGAPSSRTLGRGDALGSSPLRGALPNGAGDVAWMSLCHSMLFLSAGPREGAPFAFVQLRAARLADMDTGRAILTLAGLATGLSSKPPSLQLVFLLPDGRWQCFETPKLQFELCDRMQLEKWMQHLSEACVARPRPMSFDAELVAEDLEKVLAGAAAAAAAGVEPRSGQELEKVLARVAAPGRLPKSQPPSEDTTAAA